MHTSPNHRISSVKYSSCNRVAINVNGTKYEIVRKVAESLGMMVVEGDDVECNIYWVDGGVPTERYLELKPYQRINHFPGMGEICRKDSLVRNMKKMKKAYCHHYSFVPNSWVLPAEYNALDSYCRELHKKKRTKVFIAKPPNGAMGVGIFLFTSMEKIPQGEPLVVQEYLDKPFLMDHYKFDLRVYVLVISCDPLRLFLYNDGLVRLSTEHYATPTVTNLHNQFMHLTNYSVNRHNESFDNDDSYDKGSKRTIKFFNAWLAARGYCVSELWTRITDMIIKTLIVANPHVTHSYQACRPGASSAEESCCFEILGFDIFLDHTLKPWLLEVNRSPSFGTDAPLDYDIKNGVLSDAFKLLNVKPTDRHRCYALRKANSRKRLLLRGQKADEGDDKPWELSRKQEEIRQRLLELRREKLREEFETLNMGNYQRIYPTGDAMKDGIYSTLLSGAETISLVGKLSSPRRNYVSNLQQLEEQQLLDQLVLYETEEVYGSVSVGSRNMWSQVASRGHTSAGQRPPPFQASALPESSTMEASYQAMVAREHEEEQTQRSMLALNKLKLMVVGKTAEEAEKDIAKVKANWMTYQSDIASFWLTTLNRAKRKELIIKVRDVVNDILRSYWQQLSLESVRLHHIMTKLFRFLLSKNGQGLLTCFTSPGLSWESLFKKPMEVISVTEMHCCKRVVQLCQQVLIAVYMSSTSTKKPLVNPHRRKVATATAAPPTAANTTNLSQFQLQNLSLPHL